MGGREKKNQSVVINIDYESQNESPQPHFPSPPPNTHKRGGNKAFYRGARTLSEFVKDDVIDRVANLHEKNATRPSLPPPVAVVHYCDTRLTCR